MSKKLIIPAVLLLFSVSSHADVENGDTYSFQKRSESDCSDLNPEMAQWFRSSEVAPAPTNKILGEVKNQQSSGWCFAYVAAEMITAETGYKISPAHIAKNYYDKSFRARFFNEKDGGLVPPALKLSFNTPLCEEDKTPYVGVNASTIKSVTCNEPVVNLENNYRVVRDYRFVGQTGGVLFPKLDDILSRGKIAGIHYVANLMIGKKIPKAEQSDPDHASSIVGRFFDRNENVCRYIIRNSWGPKCDYKNSNFVCKSGYYVVTEEHLNQSLIEVISLERK